MSAHLIAWLRTIDPAVVDLVASCRHTVLYRNDPTTKSWVEYEVFGPLLLVEKGESRAVEMMILNQEGNENFYFLPSSIRVLLHRSPYIIFQTSMGGNVDIWSLKQKQKRKKKKRVAQKFPLSCPSSLQLQIKNDFLLLPP
jgi:hypothetical protein